MNSRVEWANVVCIAEAHQIETVGKTTFYPPYLTQEQINQFRSKNDDLIKLAWENYEGSDRAT